MMKLQLINGANNMDSIHTHTVVGNFKRYTEKLAHCRRWYTQTQESQTWHHRFRGFTVLQRIWEDGKDNKSYLELWNIKSSRPLFTKSEFVTLKCAQTTISLFSNVGIYQSSLSAMRSRYCLLYQLKKIYAENIQGMIIASIGQNLRVQWLNPKDCSIPKQNKRAKLTKLSRQLWKEIKKNTRYFL